MYAKEEIRRNQVVTRWIIGAFMVILGLLGGYIDYAVFGGWYIGAVVCIAVGWAYVYAITFFGTNIMMKMNHAREVRDKEEYPMLYNIVSGVALSARISRPRIFIIEDESPNAFASGFSPEKASVAVTTGLLELLNRQELEGVIAHEVAHVKNNDVKLMTMVTGLVIFIAFVSDRARYLVRAPASKRNIWFVVFLYVFVLLAPFVAFLLKMVMSRNREYLADAEAVEITSNPGAMASALKKVSGYETPVKQASPSLASLYFEDPLKKKSKVDWFSTHPSVKNRLERLGEVELDD